MAEKIHFRVVNRPELKIALIFNALFICASAVRAAPRAPAAAGRFYPAKAAELGALADRLMKEAPAEKFEGEIAALLVPHAGLEYSGATAARAYKLLPKGRWDAVVVVGTGHFKELEGAAIYPGDYATPEGSLRYDAELAKNIAKETPLVVMDAAAHNKEHSIEVQLPFLRRALGSVKLVALVMNTQDLESARVIGRALAAASKGRRVLFVASSDQSHYPTGAVSDAVDRATLLALETMDPAYFWLTNRLLMNRGLDSLAVTYCGEGAVTAVMTAARALGASRAQVLAHINSGDVVSERTYNHVVGYAAAVFLTGARPRAAAPFTPAQRKELLELSRRSISAYLKGGRMPAVPLNADPRLDLPGAAFVTLSKADGTLRGCIGSLEAQESVAESVAHNAVAAAVQDPRFKPVTASELPGLRVEISMLTRPVAVKNASEIKAGDGVTVERDGRSGVFLPQVWEQLGKRDEFLSELCAQKAKLERDCWKDPKTALKVFSAEVFRE